MTAVPVSLGVAPTSAPAVAPVSSLAGAAAEARRRAAQREQSRARRNARVDGRERRQRSIAELSEIARRGQAELGGSGIGAPDEASAEDVIAWAVEQFGDSLAVASSMTDSVLSYLVSRQLPWVDVLFGDTGYHFAETLGTRDAVAHSIEVTVVDVRPRLSVAEQDEAYGADLFARDPESCCRMRKVEPMREILGGYEAWATGLRRADSGTRAKAPLVTFDHNNNLVKINPIAAWSDDQLVGYALRHGLTVNPLLNDGYPSIGCEPCTRRVSAGEDPRAGRWSGVDKTECGLHI
ncbi:phosphoadenosine phosphosulfate reductase [Isoptericola jiangsuensis]|uniref:Adenosine 5'-phosphosulfate reductase n=1 Tax=Isoptericola jiangsuensis TaxID=548579 RepID=A0A2A9EUU8_9MICO|nr:phosphoadenylyl-sulfate reductase [Isoptericola jiangsuensis]PFG42301.1 phosphoadenosine phosphosulfate reductase [Isoptericola jiangsuensis]